MSDGCARASAPSVPTRRAALRRRTRLALLTATFSTFVALTSHLAAGAAMPALPGILVPLALAIVVSMWCSPIRTDWLRLGLSVAASQFAFHALFMLGTPQVVAAPSHAHHATHAELATQLAAHLGSSSVHLGHDRPLMIWLHLAAAVLTTVTLHYGESVLHGLDRVRQHAHEFFGFVLTLGYVAIVPEALPVPAQPTATNILPLAARPRTATPRRGPPALA